MALVSLENLTRFYAKLKEKDLITLNQVYPVGSIYMSVNSTDPTTLFGGTWEQLKDRFLLSCGDTYSNGATGGEANHTLTVAEMPAHNHSASTNSTGSHTHSASSGSAGSHNHTGNTNTTGNHTHTLPYGWSGGGGSYPDADGNNSSHWGNQGTTAAGNHSHSFTTSTASNHSHSVTVNSGGSHSHTVTVNNNGSGNAHNNMPPYLAVYMWKRTA